MAKAADNNKCANFRGLLFPLHFVLAAQAAIHDTSRYRCGARRMMLMQWGLSDCIVQRPMGAVDGRLRGQDVRVCSLGSLQSATGRFDCLCRLPKLATFGASPLPLPNDRTPGWVPRRSINQRVSDRRAADQAFSSLKMSRSLVSGMKMRPITKVIRAMQIGYHRPEKMLPVAATMAKAVGGRKPPNQPLPMW